MSIHNNRRDFLKSTAIGAAGAMLGSASFQQASVAATPEADKQMRIGLVTYLWGAKWDLPTVIANCEQGGLQGVELRTTHKHNVEPDLSSQQRAEVKQRFADSSVELLGPGSNEKFDHVDADRLKKAIDRTKQFLQLSHDVGGSGVKVKPDHFHEGVSREQTIEQIGKSLRELARFAKNLGQEVRLEIHGSCNSPAVIKSIMEVADHPQAVVCWNCNAIDFKSPGLEENFKMVRKYFGQTCHIHDLRQKVYPFDKFIPMLAASNYQGFCLIEERPVSGDIVAVMKENVKLFHQLAASGSQQK